VIEALITIFVVGACLVSAVMIAIRDIHSELGTLRARIVSLMAQVRRLREACPYTCKGCGGTFFVLNPDEEDEWVCKSCRQPAPSCVSSELDEFNNPRTIN